ncbi:MAG: M28 family metallopeptidase [Bacteroidota bacterium]|nr:M28 family metallopeptidase [Bacteroidota bacterium]MDW8137157.1 M28 family metallopeptidase [Bacteroidota bacterium]
MRGFVWICLLGAPLGLVLGCGPSREADLEGVLAGFSADTLARHIQVLSSDAFEGRRPGTRGETLTVRYVESVFRRLGLEPGNPNGTYVQEVPLVAITTDPGSALVRFVRGGRRLDLAYADEVVVNTRQVRDSVRLENAEVVFVGYGVNAPEVGWNDYKTDVRGKVVLVLINDPDYETADSSRFRGKAMTYYGRWTYKFEEASRQGAAACFIIHEEGPAGYPWATVRNSWTGPQFNLESPDGNASRVPLEGWITWEKARELFRLAGLDLDALKSQAQSPDFRPVSLGGVRFTGQVRTRIERVRSRNVIAKLTGSKRPEEYVLYVAHWDHLGRDTTLQGDQIFNGAVDNASGTAGLLELARAFARLRHRPERTVLFLAVTAEEQGLLGSAYYAENPLYPLAQTVAVLNLDGMNVYGRTRDLVVIGYGQNELEDMALPIVQKQGRQVRPDPEPEKGFYYRSDHFSFAKKGVPAFYAEGGEAYVGKPEGYGREVRARYTAERYHRPQDEFDPAWDLSGAVEDLQLYFELGWRLANSAQWPNWKPGSEFKAIRDAMRRPA